MANDPVEVRLSLVMHEYLEDLASLGAFGSTKAGVARTYIEQGVQKALADKLINVRRGPLDSAN